MKDEMNLTIKNFGPINEANIDIGRINVKWDLFGRKPAI